MGAATHAKTHGLDESAAGGGAAASPIVFRLNGDVSLVTPSAANTYAGDGIFDGQVPLVPGQTYDSVTLYQRLDGAADSTTAELYHFTGGAWVEVTLSGALTLAAGGGADQEITRTFTAIVGAAGERFSMQLTAVQSADETDTPTDVIGHVFEAP